MASSAWPTGSARPSARRSATPAWAARGADRAGRSGAARTSRRAGTWRTCPTWSRSPAGSSRPWRSCSPSASRAACPAPGPPSLLWVNRVPFSATGAVTDPIFGRDISYFLFELPFLRWAQSLFNGLMLATLLVVGARYLAQATEGGEVFVTRVRVHLAVLAGLYLLSVAFGYQLDKYELVYSTAGATGAVGVGYTDANARFMAYDVLTVLSGLAGALLIAGAFTRWLWPLGAIVVIWVSASLVLGRLYPEAIQRLTVDPNEYAQEQPYIANNIAMTRLAFGLDAWDTRSYAGTAPADAGRARGRGGHVHQRAAVGLPAAPGHARPAADRAPVLRLHRRRHRPLPRRRDHAPGDAVRPRAGDRAQPPGVELGQPAGHLHPRHRDGDGARQRGDPGGPAGAVGARPAAGQHGRARPRSPSPGSTSARRTRTTS